ncbi:MAG TPA: adenosylcobinamide-GDP ribazoletransferase [Paracoccaceae bacterium]|nr:adenosylcobinamide-GDP ribazoletransferase [Paracoccaceae bacterium]
MNRIRRRVAELQIALMFMTRLPPGPIRGEVPSLADARWAYPLAGLVVGGLAWCGHALALAAGLPPSVAAVSAIAIMALATGGLHFDGLADLADGIGGGRDAEHRLRIMRDSHIGSYGALALLLVTALIGASIASFPPGRAMAGAFLFSAVTSRLAMLAVLEWLPPVRADGLGRDASGHNPCVLLPGLGICAGTAWLAGSGSVPALLSAAVTVFAIAHLARRKIGGQTGDVLGAIQLATEAACWLTLATRS